MTNKSLKDEIYEALSGHGVKYINVNRDADIHGTPSIAIEVYATDRGTPHEFTFAKGNKMDAEHMAKVIISYLRNRT